MKVLLVWPILPNSFWSYQETLDLAGLRSTTPPLGLMTVAAMLPASWELKLIDRNVALETDADWDWCELVIISAMLVQRQDLDDLIRKAVRLGKKVAVGGPFVTSVPDFALQAGAQYLILDEGEITIPLFLAALERGDATGTFRATEKPDVTTTPIPRFDLLNLDAYLLMTLQFSRGCPFQCEFCDIINLFGRKPRTKAPAQMLAELDALYQTGWRRTIFLVDDNFIGNSRNAKLFLRELIPWMQAHRYPFTLMTEASLNLAEDEELMELMVQAGFTMVFMGIETPDVESLGVAHKEQNMRHSLIESCQKINQQGLQILSGFILGFDGERTGAGARIQAFVEATSIPVAHLTMLGALHNTAMWTRLQQEGRLIEEVIAGEHFTTQLSLMNFVPTRPIAEITREFIDAFWNLYEPLPYLKRAFNHFQMIGNRRPSIRYPITDKEIRLFLTICWRQGLLRSTRWRFWMQLWAMRQKPSLLYDYFTVLGLGEHFFNFRHQVRAKLEEQLAALEPEQIPETAEPVEPVEACLI